MEVPNSSQSGSSTFREPLCRGPLDQLQSRYLVHPHIEIAIPSDYSYAMGRPCVRRQTDLSTVAWGTACWLGSWQKREIQQYILEGLWVWVPLGATRVWASLDTILVLQRAWYWIANKSHCDTIWENTKEKKTFCYVLMALFPWLFEHFQLFILYWALKIMYLTLQIPPLRSTP